MTSRLAELEAGLVEDGRWNLDQLAVYADHLHAEGDPRGELILLDLHGGPEVADRRRELLGGFLGKHAANPAICCRRGFLDLVVDDHTDLDMIAELGPFIRSVHAVGSDATIAGVIDALAAEPRPWLTYLGIRHLGPNARPCVSGRSFAAFAQSTPRLDALAILGVRVFEHVAHRTLRRLQLTGIDVILSVRDVAPWLPSVVELDLELVWFGIRLEQAWTRYLPRAQFPLLRRLDLSRNGASHFIDPTLRYLEAAAIAPQLTHVAMPPLHSAEHVAIAQAALDRMPRLRRLEHAAPAPLRHPTAQQTGYRHAWRPLDRTSRTFELGHRRIEVDLGEASWWLDDHHDTLAPPVRDAWEHLARIHQPHASDPREVSAQQLVIALAATDGRVWPELLRAVEAGDHGPNVTIPLV